MAADIDDTLENVIADAMKHAQRSMWTMLPGRVQSYDGSAQTAAIELMVKDLQPERDLPVLPCVPVVMLRGNGLFISVPIVPGTTGMVLFSSLDMSRWRNTGQVAAPSDNRRSQLGSAAFLPGLVPAGSALPSQVTDAVVIAKEGGTQDFAAVAGLVMDSIDALTKAFNAHVHATAGVGAPSPPTLAVPGIPVGVIIPVPTGVSVASDSLKVTS